MSVWYSSVPTSGSSIMRFRKRLRLSGILLSLARSVGLIIMIRPKHFGAVLQAVTTKEPDKPDAITSVGHPMTCLMKVTMSCTYKKFVYVIAGLSERPQREDRVCRRCDPLREYPQYTAIRGRWRHNVSHEVRASGFRCLFLCKKYRRTARRRSLFRSLRAGFSVWQRYRVSYLKSKSLHRTSWLIH